MTGGEQEEGHGKDARLRIDLGIRSVTKNIISFQ